MGYVTEYAYDAVGNLISATLPNGETYAYTYNHSGFRTSETDPLGNVTQWEPDLLFEVKARQLKLLRLRAHRYADKALLNRKMEILLGTLVTIDPVRAAVLCDTQHKD